MIGAQGGPYQSSGSWQIFTSYRWWKSDRHFVGSVEQKHRREEGSEFINRIHLLDFGATYAVNNRLNLSVSMPILFADRSQVLRAEDRSILERFDTQARGISDVTAVARLWVGDPENHPNQNLSLGLGIKIPTGNKNVEDTFRVRTGDVVVDRVRAVDQSIQPGDGGTGLVFDAQGFKLLFERLTLFGSGTYVANPRNTSGPLTDRPNGYSVADQYVARVGVMAPLSLRHGMGIGFGSRIEGAPARDLIGKSDGSRRPGYAVSVEPTFVWSRGQSALMFSLPYAVYRNRTWNVSDVARGSGGDAAFADYVVLIGITHRFH